MDRRASTVIPEQMEGKRRVDLKPGMLVEIVLKKDQSTGALTKGRIGRLLTKSATHPHGIKVMLEDGQVGRVQKIHKGDNES